MVDTTGKPTGPGTPIDCYNRFLIDFSNSFIGVNINLTISIWDKFGEKIHDLPVKHTGLFSKDEKGVFVPFDWMNNDTIPLGAVSLIAQYPPMKEIIGCELPDYFTILFLGHETTSNKKELVYYYEKTVCGF